MSRIALLTGELVSISACNVFLFLELTPVSPTCGIGRISVGATTNAADSVLGDVVVADAARANYILLYNESQDQILFLRDLGKKWLLYILGVNI